MRLQHLPVSLLLLVAAQAAAQDQALPTAIRKMSPDQGEKFFPHYYGFAPVFPQGQLPLAARDDPEASMPSNSSLIPPFEAALAPHEKGMDRGWDLFRRAAEALALLEKRQWGCPSGTLSCIGIGYQFSCCRSDSTCYRVPDTGLGPVGCCAKGSNCGGSITNCGPGDTGCPSVLGGGCCMRGYVCQGVGCVLSSSVAPSPTLSSTTLTTTSTTVIPGAGPSTVVVTVVITLTNGGSTTTRTTTQTTTSTPSPTQAPPTTTSTGGEAPLKPTLTGTDTQLFPSGFCPTGFYACLASAGGGCCQTGRDCATTSCPPVALTTLVSGGHTVVVPAEGVPTPGAKSCAGGWFMCPASVGPIPGCCPTGYSCGTASCSIAGPQGTGTVAKELPSGAGDVARGGVWGVISALLALLVL